MALSFQSPQPSGAIYTTPSLPNSWSTKSTSLRSSRHPSPFSRELSLSPCSPISTGLLSPIARKRSSPYSTGSSCHEPLDVKLPIRSLRTPSATPEPSKDGVYSRRSSQSYPHDPILQNLNRLRKAKNKKPLPLVEGLHDPDFVRKPLKPLVPLELAQRGRGKLQRGSHCNIKYLVEELDYIRYHRVDLARAWKPIASDFQAMFPMSIFPRGEGGLQGVYYRQHKMLPLISDGQLVFMENGHVEPVWVKTKKQTEKNQLYGLIYLFPERAMNYSWVSLLDRQRAYELNQEREPQVRKAHFEAKRRGTYIEKLPPHVLCGCCPGDDRKRDPGSLKQKIIRRKSSLASKKYSFRAKL
ncbi:hypothetical protein F5Y12DRAFT_301564 [Xylaria sp. FL1777]|nr:hypothetical protein F5Y12DRAFT_301564 [Xylaria sp. FL1777]